MHHDMSAPLLPGPTQAPAQRAVLLRGLIPQLNLSGFLSGHPKPDAGLAETRHGQQQPPVMQQPGPAARYVADTVWVGAALSIAGLSVGLPIMSFTPGGWFDDEGMMVFVSGGFRKHNLEATVLLMTCTPLVVWARLQAILRFVRSLRLAALGLLFLLLFQVSGALVVRTDVFQEWHFIAALAFMVSNGIYQLIVIAPLKGSYFEWTRRVWLLETALGLVFVGIQVSPGSSHSSTLKRSVGGTSQHLAAQLMFLVDALILYKLRPGQT